MAATLGIVCNLYNEVNALPGWLEAATALADHVAVYHSGPGGAMSDDGTIEILEKWKVPITFGSIDEGFGAVRTKTLRCTPCDWAMLLDADERVHRYMPVLTCTGESTPAQEVDRLLYDYGDPNYREVQQGYDKAIDFSACPSNFENMARLGAKLRVSAGEVFDHGKVIRDLIENADLDCIRTIRRHWHDSTWNRPTQNWHTDPDFQARLVRNRESVYFASVTRMHEKLEGAAKTHTANHSHGPFFDHYHLLFKKMEVKQRQYDVAVYNAIADGKPPPKWEEFK